MNPKEVIQHELIGLTIEVISAENKSLIGLKGKIVDETRNLLILENGKKIIKSNATFKIKFKNKNISVRGSLLVGRPEDRLKQRIR